MPDLYAPVSRQMYDVKTTGFRSEFYTGRRSNVDEKAASVPAQYRSRARHADEEYNDSPAGTVGPVEAKLASMPQVECFSVGAFGEVNKAVGKFISALADKGSDVPERFGCCHGKEQARGIVAQFLGRRLGRTLLRGVVRLRHVALSAIGGVDTTGIKVFGSSVFLGNEWDAAGRSWIPFS